jgi:hypothetical protein
MKTLPYSSRNAFHNDPDVLILHVTEQTDTAATYLLGLSNRFVA